MITDSIDFYIYCPDEEDEEDEEDEGDVATNMSMSESDDESSANDSIVREDHALGTQHFHYTEVNRWRYQYNRLPNLCWEYKEGLQMLLYTYDQGYKAKDGTMFNMICSGCSNDENPVFLRKGDAVCLLANPFKRHGDPYWVHLNATCLENSQVRDLILSVVANEARGNHVINADEQDGVNVLKDLLAHALNEPSGAPVDSWDKLMVHLYNPDDDEDL